MLLTTAASLEKVLTLGQRNQVSAAFWLKAAHPKLNDIGSTSRRTVENP